MCVYQSNLLIEWLARIRYFFLCRIRQAEPVEHVVYRDRRWYRLDRHNRVIRMARTYFDVMQPH